jgi:hypothetical protein
MSIVSCRLRPVATPRHVDDVQNRDAFALKFHRACQRRTPKNFPLFEWPHEAASPSLLRVVGRTLQRGGGSGRRAREHWRQRNTRRCASRASVQHARRAMSPSLPQRASRRRQPVADLRAHVAKGRSWCRPAPENHLDWRFSGKWLANSSVKTLANRPSAGRRPSHQARLRPIADSSSASPSPQA